MTRVLVALTVIALVLSPAVALGQAKADEQTKATGDGAGQTIKDSWLTTKTKIALVADKRVKARQIKVETQGGVVTLRGKVATAEERIAAEEVAKGVDDVKSVSNALQVVPDAQRETVNAKDDEIEKAVKERLDRHLKDSDIKVRCDNSVVTLMGTVPDVKTKTRALDVTRKVPGVKAVRSEIRQKS